jgi:hypothetical protein
MSAQVRGVSSDPGVDAFNQILNREAAVATSAPVIRRVIARARPGMTPAAVTAASEVSVDEQASLLIFSAEGPDPPPGHR